MKALKDNLYMFAFLEGAVVMAVELMVARMIAPFFGSSLYVWGAVIGVTFFCLAIGYFLGGIISDKYPRKNTLYWIMLLSSLVIIVMPSMVEGLTVSFSNSSPISGVIIISVLCLLPTLGFLGMVPTILIRLKSEKIEESGKTTGNVYTISSIGGIVGIFLMGFWIIPEAGLTKPSIFIGIILGIIPFFQLIRQKKFLSLVFVLFIIIGLSASKKDKIESGVNVKYYSEGLLGQILVTDVSNKMPNGAISKDRLLFVNRMGQTFINMKTGQSRWSYISYLTAVSSSLPENSKVLLLGLGGGTVANKLEQALNFQIDAVEFDSRIAKVASRYFKLSKSVNTIIDDARHYIETCEKKYDLIVFDVFKGETPPAHVLTLECFTKAKTLLNENGFIVVNFNGFISDENGRAGRCLYKTIVEAGFEALILPTWESEEQRNNLFIALQNKSVLDSVRLPLYKNGIQMNLDTLFLNTSTLNFDKDFVLTDDKPILAKFNLEAANIWRRGYNEAYTKNLIEKGVPLFE